LRTVNISDYKKYLSNHQNYIVLGELKGGCDPAGADEHWKTARTSLDRINNSFNISKYGIKTIFIGAAIEKAMAIEMYNLVLQGKISKCANLSNPIQIAEICNWIVDL
jgi:hypothetical protein